MSGRVSMESPARIRRHAGLVLIGVAALLATATTLKPDPRGYGTHEQLGFPACRLLRWTGVPCPFCGMTTAFAHAVRGEFLSAGKSNPAGLVAFALTMVLAILAGASLVTGRPYLGGATARLNPVRVWYIAGAVTALSWAYVTWSVLAV